jgi:hypothetical protein
LIHPSLFSILFLYIIELGIVLTIAEIMLVWRYAITNQSIQLFPCPQCPGRWFTPGTPVSSTKKNWTTRYNWNIVKSGVKNHKPDINVRVIF